MLDLSIVIVNYKSPHLITQCLQSIIYYEKVLQFEILVVDNNSEDNTEALLKSIYPQLQWIQMGYNSGFSRANNAGIKAAIGAYILLLNSDVVLKHPNTLAQCLHYYNTNFSQNKTILGTRLVNTDGTYQETLRLNFPSLKREWQANPLFIFVFSRVFKKNSRSKLKQKEAHYRSGKVAWINGAFLLMHKQTIRDQHLFFDEDFFLYGEDMEWAWRANKRGLKFHHWHEQELIHIGSASMPDNQLKRSQIIVSDWLFIKKTRGSAYLFILLLMVCFNISMDGVLDFLARIRGRKLSSEVMNENKFRSIYWYLLTRYGLQILCKKRVTSNFKFDTNCYEDSHIRRKAE